MLLPPMLPPMLPRAWPPFPAGWPLLLFCMKLEALEDDLEWAVDAHEDRSLLPFWRKLLSLLWLLLLFRLLLLR